MTNPNNYHNQGQEDASNGVDNPPHDLGSRLFDLITFNSRPESEYQQDIEDYNAGHSHTESQIRGR
jgi:hypothetical protein